MTALDKTIRLRCGLELEQRVAMAPLTNTQSNSDGTLGDEELRWLLRRAEGGFRWISTCAAYVSAEGKAWDGQLGIASDAHVPGLTRLAAALRDAGATPVVQLYHGGCRASLAPDRPLSTFEGGKFNTRAASHDDLRRVIDDFIVAAQRAEHAGFAGVEIHGANGYLFTQFIAPKDNPRDDEYGGDLAGRARFLREAMRAVRDAMPASFCVGVRLSPVDLWNRRGLELAEGVQVAAWMADDGADFVHLSLQDASASAPHEDSDVPVARAVRDAVAADVPIFAAGGMWTLADAERAFDAGVDVAVLGKACIAHPDWPRVAVDPEWQPSRPPWTADQLRAADVGESLLTYLGNFRGLVASD